MASDSDDSDKLVPPGDTLGDLLFADPVPLSESRSVIARYYRSRSLDIFVRWGLESDDENAKKATTKLAKHGWSEEQRRRVLDTVDQIVHTERAKPWKAPNPELSQRYTRIAGDAVNAAKLALALHEWCPSPTFEESAPATRELVVRLVDFVSSCLHETAIADHYMASQIAKDMLTGLKNDFGPIPAGLMADLVWLALGKTKESDVEDQLDEATIRRYGKNVKKTGTPAGKVWKAGWGVVVATARLVPPDDQGDTFARDVRAFLRAPGRLPLRPGPRSV